MCQHCKTLDDKMVNIIATLNHAMAAMKAQRDRGALLSYLNVLTATFECHLATSRKLRSRVEKYLVLCTTPLEGVPAPPRLPQWACWPLRHVESFYELRTGQDRAAHVGAGAQ